MTNELQSTPLPWPPSWPTWQRSAIEIFQQTVTLNPWIPKRAPSFGPHPKQQRFLLHANATEAMYGGAAGGGKTDALLSAAAQFVDVPGYSALILRESLPDLKQPDSMIPRSKSWWSDTEADWHSSENRWTFPSGATISFGYLERDDDVYQYDSAAFQCIIIDELTRHSEWRYRFMFGRLRKPADGPLSTVPLRMRSASNPGGKGHAWVKKRFVNQRTREPGAIFVPATIDDNPSLDRDAYIRNLTYLDPLTRRQRMQGDWEALAGGRFLPEWRRYYRRYGTGYICGNRTFPLEDLRKIFLTVDPAASVKQTASQDPDYTVISAWAITPDVDLLWLGCVRMRCEVPDIIPRIAEQYLLHRAGVVYIEGGGPQKGVAQFARRCRTPRMNVVEVLPVKDALVRLTPALNLAEGGRLWLPAEDPRFPLDDVDDELLRFTGDTKQQGHDDIVSTLAYAGQVADNKLRGKQSDFVPYGIGV